MNNITQPLRVIFLALCLMAGWRQAVAAPWVTAHYVYWEEDVLAPAQIDMTPITHLIYFAALPNADGTLDTSNLDEPAAVAAAAHNAGKLALVCVGGGDDAIYAGFTSAITAAHRATFVANIVSWVKNNGYDGVDIDMEPINDSDTSNFVAFIQALSTALKANNASAVLTADIAVESSAPADAFVPVVNLFDQINLETYDLSGNYPGWVTWYDSCIYTNNQTFPQDSGGGPLPSADQFLQQWIGYGIPAAKLGLGINCQGLDWTGATGPQQGIAGVVCNYRDYNDIITNSYSAARYHYDNGAKASYLSLANDFISYTDPALCADQVTYVRNQGLGGLMVWQIQAQYMPNGDQPLLQAIATALGSTVTFTVTPSAGANGTISPNTAQTVASGTNIGFIATPANGYVVNQWLVNGSVVQTSGSTYTLNDVTANATVQVTFAPAAVTFTVTPSAGANGGISPNTAQTVNSGASIGFTATPANGYVVNQWLVNGSVVQTSGSTYELTNVTANTTVQVTFAPAAVTFTVTPSAGANGAISPNTAQTVNSGANIGFTATPANGYIVNQWLVNGGVVQTSGSTYTLNNVTANAAVQVTFAPAAVTFTVTPSAGANGTISPNTAQIVNSGANIGFTATPANGYIVNQWLVNGGVVQTSGSTYELNNVTANTTVQVTFAPAAVTFTVTPNTGANGAISPNTAQIVNSGASIGFTATPASGYAVDQWYLDGNTVQTGGTTYTLSNVQASHAVEVTFTASSPVTPFPGIYDGLLADGSGFVTISLSAKGKFTGKVIIAGVSHPLKGQFNSMGAWQGTAFGNNVSLQLSGQGGTPGGYFLTGSVGGTSLTAYHTAHIIHAVAPETGKYILQLTGTSLSSTIPQVPGKATLTVSRTGSAHLSGKLPGATSFSASATIVGGLSGDQCIIYSTVAYKHATPRGARGFLIGAITFPSGTVTGTLDWIKPAQTTGAFPAPINTGLTISQ